MKLASTVKDNYIPLNNLAAQHLPFVPPRLDDNGVKFAPLILQMVEFCLCFFLCVSGIDQLQIFEEFLPILTSDILHGFAYLMHDAQLYVSIGKYALNGVREAG